MKVLKRLRSCHGWTINVVERPNEKIDLIVYGSDRDYTVLIEPDKTRTFLDIKYSGDMNHKEMNTYIISHTMSLYLALEYYRAENKLNSKYPITRVAMASYKRRMKHIRKFLNKTHYLIKDK